MTSKKYLGKTCVYCGRPDISGTADHVIARKFFFPADRINVPIVPACSDCNGKKSMLEHYVLSVLPMGSLHSAASETIQTQVGPRLARNDALRRTISLGTRVRLLMSPDGRWSEGMAVPFVGQKLADLCAYIAQGLTWHHWMVQLAPHAIVRGTFVSSEALHNFEWTWNQSEQTNRITGEYGDGVFSYRGVRGGENSKTTMWDMSFFGGVELADPARRGTTITSVFVGSSDGADWVAISDNEPEA